MDIAIVGATGVLGRSLVPLLAAAGHTVRALVRSPERASSIALDSVRIERFDLLDEADAPRLVDLLSGCDVIVHAATAIPSDFSAPGAWDANTRIRGEGTRRLIDASLAAGVSRYIQQSIAFAYPDRGDEWIDEELPLDPTWSVVVEMEEMVKAIPLDRMGWCILRGGIFVGPGTFEERTISNVRDGTEPIICGGDHFLPLVHVDDVASAFAAAIERAPAGSTFNIVDDPIRQRDYIENLAARLGAPAPPRSDVTPCPPSHRCSNERARRVLGWKPGR